MFRRIAFPIAAAILFTVASRLPLSGKRPVHEVNRLHQEGARSGGGVEDGVAGSTPRLRGLHLPLVRHEQQIGIGLALRKEVLFRRGAIKSSRQRAPGSSLTATDRAELDNLIARLERRLAAAGRGAKVAAE